jgi:hypothetical protein
MWCGLFRSALFCSGFRHQRFAPFRCVLLRSCAKCLIVSQSGGDQSLAILYEEVGDGLAAEDLSSS